ncbi:hypothetical protein M0R19_03270 [Candidatus Pacearchaeota archaeon]|jgi:hypothetical protein|nr:hypothetical protein [Candidatus Pacearchaeota archaeon]
MGYTHYWHYTPITSLDEMKNNFKKSIPSLEKILDSFKELVCFEMGAEDVSAFLSENTIRFNGKLEEAHETFSFSTLNLRSFNFCKTARKEYDIVVCACLIVLQHFIPGLTVSSDGLCERENSENLIELINSKKTEQTWKDALKFVLKNRLIN